MLFSLIKDFCLNLNEEKKIKFLEEQSHKRIVSLSLNVHLQELKCKGKLFTQC